MNPTVAVTGIKAVIQVLEKQKKNYSKAMEEAMKFAANIVKIRALYYCPVEWGPLRESVEVDVKGQGAYCQIALSFGGPSAPYALYVHEDLTKYHAAPTSAKFLSKAVYESKMDIIKTVKSFMAAANKSGAGYNLGATLSKTINGNSV